ncbi:G-protein coupled receptor Mth2-like [Anoplolepis gracilipes]|uniref:G-protein coupled receptor Mth2-like n=1 Tax=Anoplolepis gracilipes TaxID=354296 RepID=UPI003B9DE19E
MCGKSFTFWYCSFLLILVVASLSKSQQTNQNSISNTEENKNFTIQYELVADSTTNYDETKALQYDLYKKSTNSTHDIQYNDVQTESSTNSTSNSREDNDSLSVQYDLVTFSTQSHEDDKQMSMEPRTNSTNGNQKENVIAKEINENLMNVKDKNETNIVPYEMCKNDDCVKLCCPLGHRLDDQDDRCIPDNIKYTFPNVYTNNSLQSEKRVDELFQMSVYDPCQTHDHRFLLPYGYQYDFKIYTNGSLYLSYYKRFIKWSSYCFAVIDGDKVEVTICSKTADEVTGKDTKSIESIKIIYVSFHIVSVLFLVSIFLIYSILPALQNVHGFMLRNYSGALAVAYIIDIVNILVKANGVEYPICLTIAFFNYLCFLTSFLWLTIMSFDMWWTFRGLFSLQKNIKQREKNKLVFYAIYAWGLPFIFATTSIIMDYFSEYLPEILRPEFRTGDCWFAHKGSFALYYYGLKSVCIISSICLSISTAVKIARYEKDTGRRLTDSESKQYNDNKKWFNLYLKLFILLFIVMGIKWSMMTISWLSQTISLYNSYAINLVDIIQNLCTFIIFVWKKKIKRMLLKRFGCGGFVETQSTNATSMLNSTTSTTGGESLAMQKKSSCGQKNCHAKGNPFDGTDL